MNIRATYLSFKNLKVYYFIPLILLYVFLPILSIGIVYIYESTENAYFIIFKEVEKYIPILSIWWTTFIFREYIEEDGNEVLYCINETGKVKVSQIILIFLWYVVHVGILYLGFSIFWDNMILEFIKIVIQSLFFSSLLYLLIYTLKSTTISFMLLVIYELFMLFINSEIVNYISIFHYGENLTVKTIITKYVLILLVSIVFLIAGVYQNKRFYY